MSYAEEDYNYLDIELSRATDRIEALSAEVKQKDALIEKLQGAISWIEPPFIDENTPESELRSRIRFCVADAKRAALGAKP
jgi:predicted  nucleic acid-binding Zn-ribbon protein